jgi:hypothetical protein
MQAYQRDAETTRPVVAFVTFYRDGVKAFETSPVAATEGLNVTSKAVPLFISLSLGELPAGEYTCQVSILDPGGQKAAFWQATVMIIP